MEFIAQFKSSIIGSNNTLVNDVFLYNNNIVMFSKKSNGDFDLTIIEKNSYTTLTGEFEEFIKNKDVRSRDCNILNLDRASKVLNPVLMPDRYYKDILSVYELQRTIRKNQLRRLSDSANKIYSEILDELDRF